jgi:hypothetical protein
MGLTEVDWHWMGSNNQLLLTRRWMFGFRSIRKFFYQTTVVSWRKILYKTCVSTLPYSLQNNINFYRPLFSLAVESFCLLSLHRTTFSSPLCAVIAPPPHPSIMLCDDVGMKLRKGGGESFLRYLGSSRSLLLDGRIRYVEWHSFCCELLILAVLQLWFAFRKKTSERTDCRIVLHVNCEYETVDWGALKCLGWY